MAFDKKQYAKEYYLKHKEKLLNKQNEYYKTNKNIYEAYYENNKKKIIEHQKEYPMARANMLLCAYNNSDKKRGRGKGDLTAKWIVDNIFSKHCVHCGESDWRKIGCNRLDNSKPHTKDNVEPCCFKCNASLNKMERDNLGRYKKRDTN